MNKFLFIQGKGIFNICKISNKNVLQIVILKIKI